MTCPHRKFSLVAWGLGYFAGGSCAWSMKECIILYLFWITDHSVNISTDDRGGYSPDNLCVVACFNVCKPVRQTCVVFSLKHGASGLVVIDIHVTCLWATWNKCLWRHSVHCRLWRSRGLWFFRCHVNEIQSIGVVASYFATILVFWVLLCVSGPLQFGGLARLKQASRVGGGREPLNPVRYCCVGQTTLKVGVHFFSVVFLSVYIRERNLAGRAGGCGRPCRPGRGDSAGRWGKSVVGLGPDVAERPWQPEKSMLVEWVGGRQGGSRHEVLE